VFSIECPQSPPPACRSRRRTAVLEAQGHEGHDAGRGGRACATACGRCCLNKLQEEGTDRTYYTDVGCKLPRRQTCRCTDYDNRSAKVKDCVTLTSRNINRISWLPPTCGYKLVAAGQDLYWWHPLVSGDPDTVHQAGVSVRGKVGANEINVKDAGSGGSHRELAAEVAEGREGVARAPAEERANGRGKLLLDIPERIRILLTLC